MKAKKIGALLLAGVMAASMVSATSVSAADAKRVCFVARASADTFAAWLTTEIKKQAENYDDIDLTCVSGEGDDNKENGLLEDCITKQYDLVIVQSNNNGAQAPYVQQLVDAGIPVITTNPTTHQNDLDGGDDTSVMAGTGTVDADPIEQAKVSAERAVDEIPENANVVVLKGPSGNYHADKRREAWDQYFFDKRSDVKILYEDFANWNSDEALTLMESWVQAGTHIDAIISMNDNMAAGALEVVKGNPTYKDMLVYGVDGTAEACLLIQDGSMTSTCLQSAIDLAALNLDTVHKLLTGEETQIDTDIEEVLITADNVDEYVEMYKKNGQITE